MSMISGLLDRIFLVLAFICFGLFPSYLSDYKQRIGGQQSEISRSLSGFQTIADDHHDGELKNLARYNLLSDSPSHKAQGRQVQSMIERKTELQTASEALDSSLLQSLVYLAMRGDRDTMVAAWRQYDPSIPITGGPLTFMTCMALVAWALFVLGLKMTAAVARRMFQHELRQGRL